MTQELKENFEYDMYRAMLISLFHDFQFEDDRSDRKPISIEQARREICNNFHLLDNSSQITKEAIITETLYSHMYNSSEDRARLSWIRDKRKSDYTVLVGAAIALARILVYNPQSRSNDEFYNKILGFRLYFMDLLNKYKTALFTDRTTMRHTTRPH